MFPANPVQNISDVEHASIKFLGKFDVVLCPLLVLRPYFKHLFLGKLSVPVVLALFCAMLIRCVHTVHFGISKKKVGWPDARRNVTFMKQVKVIWNGTVFKYPRDSVGLCKAFLVVKNTIMMLVACSDPKPAGVFAFELIHFSPKSLFDCSASFTGKRFEFWTKLKDKANLVLHNSVQVICATLSGVRSPRGHFYCGGFGRFGQVV